MYPETVPLKNTSLHMATLKVKFWLPLRAFDKLDKEGAKTSFVCLWSK